MLPSVIWAQRCRARSRGVVLTGNQGPSGAIWVGGSASEVMPKMQIRGGSKLNVRRLIGQWVDHVARLFPER